MNEARHRQSGDELHEFLSGSRDEKRHQRKKVGCHEKIGPKAQLLSSAFLFAFLVLLFLGTFFNRKIVLDTPLPRHGSHKKLISSEDEQRTKLVPSSDKQVLKFLQGSPEIDSIKLQNNGFLRIGLVNFPKPDVAKWKALGGGRKPVLFSIDKKRDFSWSAFFPEAIDRDEEVQNRECPDMPLPSVPEDLKLDFVVARIPCGESNFRDIDRLQAAVSAAHISLKTGASHIIGVSDCMLDPNVFKCKELVRQEKGVGLYKLDLERIGKLLSLPVGSCKTVQVPTLTSEHTVSREAYATILHSVKSYVCGAVLLAHSIRKTGSTRDLIMVIDQHINLEDRQGLEGAGWKIHHIERIRNPRARPDAYNEWNYSKFRLWQLTQYDKVVFIDADVVVTRNMDFLFDLPELSAARNHKSVFNSGVMVIEPSNCTFNLLVDGISRIKSYNGGDQGYLNEIFTWWHRLPRSMNFLKHFDDDAEENEYKMELFAAEPPVLYAVHFLGRKPWLCGRGPDCNAKISSQRMFSNDFVHSKWWSWHDEMPVELQRLCRINPKRRLSPPAVHQAQASSEKRRSSFSRFKRKTHPVTQ
ncbi:UDP-glucuronate:xylan alpha-glucuronosyltransferase 1 [Selaginella moellendorffii]|uniref:UDP-glucuronate:xylan alpha-glucuronosyltransferase 1 n=1 Tax=Selaginella moellendorffii TaxID=88036 RepID=UPI000D1C25B4|nr:UDP-glucuronate:xylan alpha-glucuronosyltransferase 1 [Selaginella moellendorffii]|eukprot:XP_024529174.1 UDP-glucuronate:xylan alpha-glucuronosyltransferase 1 [Selaginella moellendorffii]